MTVMSEDGLPTHYPSNALNPRVLLCVQTGGSVSGLSLGKFAPSAQPVNRFLSTRVTGSGCMPSLGPPPFPPPSLPITIRQAKCAYHHISHADRSLKVSMEFLVPMLPSSWGWRKISGPPWPCSKTGQFWHKEASRCVFATHKLTWLPDNTQRFNLILYGVNIPGTHLESSSVT